MKGNSWALPIVLCVLAAGCSQGEPSASVEPMTEERVQEVVAAAVKRATESKPAPVVPSVFSEITTRSLRLVGSDGQARGRLYVDDSGTPALVLNHGKHSISLSANEDGAMLFLIGPNGKIDVTSTASEGIVEIKHGGPGREQTVSILGGEVKGEMRGSLMIRFNDEPRATFGVLGSEGLGMLIGENRKLIWKAEQ